MIGSQLWQCAKKQVFVVGGTHGNEPTGVHIVRSLLRKPNFLHGFSFECTAFIANPRAVELNRRYCDTDLNRCFKDNEINNPQHIHLYEHNRARHITRKVSKTEDTNVILDIHNTTANTGIFLLMSSDDIFSHQIAKYIQDKHSSREPVRIGQWKAGMNPYLPSISHSGMTVEVGPAPQGCLVSKVYHEAKECIDLALEFIEKHNQATVKEPELPTTTNSLDVYRRIGSVDYPRDNEGCLIGMVHESLQGNDFCTLKDGDPILEQFDGKVIYWDQSEHGDTVVHPYFINEAAYYEKGVAFAIAEKFSADIPEGFVKE